MVRNRDLTSSELAFDLDLYEFRADTDIKVQMLFVELDRVEKTIELCGSPYEFVNGGDSRFTIEGGKERFLHHAPWLRESICGHVSPACEGEELYNCIMEQIKDSDLHDRTIWVLAHILALKGLERFCAEAAN
jgi:hypothetical protein